MIFDIFFPGNFACNLIHKLKFLRMKELVQNVKNKLKNIKTKTNI